ncbi:MAG: hypothetical protein K8T20_08145 [Planctomycetes bacterium]|nr:hypothetical protein [Planctomycetota bacterium]
MNRIACLLLSMVVAGCASSMSNETPADRDTRGGHPDEHSSGLTAGTREPVVISVDAGDREVGGYRIELVYDNTVVRVVSVEPDPEFPAPQYRRDQFTTGVLRLVGYVVDPTGPRGLVAIARVSFESLGGGPSSRLTVRLIELVDPEGRPIKGRAEASKDRVP